MLRSHAIQVLRKATRYSKKRPNPYRDGTLKFSLWDTRVAYPHHSINDILELFMKEGLL